MRKVFLAAALLLLAPAPALAQERPAPGVDAQPVGGQEATIERWGTLGQMVEPVWVTEGLPQPRTSVSSWNKPLQVLVIRHGASDRIALGTRYADIVQEVRFRPDSGRFDITYSYEDGHKLQAVGQLEPDGTFSETFAAADGTQQRNLYKLVTPRRMQIVRQKLGASGWTTVSTIVKVGETPAEKAAREAAERARIAAEQARREAEEARRQAEEEAERAQIAAEQQADQEEAQAQQQRNWQTFQNNMREIVQRNQDQIDDTNRFRQRIADTVAAGQAEYERKQAQAREAAAEAQRLRDQANRPTQTGPSQAELQARADAESARQRQVAAQQRLAQQQEQGRQQQVQQQQQQQQQQQARIDAEARKAAENPMILWKEGVVVCEPGSNPGADWACHGPLQTTWGQLEKPSGRIAIAQACGGDGAGVRELGQAGGFRTYGCGWGINPNQQPSHDMAERYGVFVPGRTTYTCPKNQSGVCRNPN